ncbi:alpha/beta hydrolase [Paenibacillus sp. GCM10023248]|uniref:alpha/beta hydrolase n=1 Tax=Bacillales TaxID=1385 RepID=UPI0023784FF0|nr:MULTISPECIES: alpha/beta hydrolase family protein [Bacillales]MDD9268738.1 alpha/beta hydrolase family protein [Paenibacillus sp. MAHUQ-63]MDR6880029.1 S-formylglutathione hydrolase FrmB [Bacillus sp. 3255]
MAFIDCHFYSDTLGVSASMYVLLPQAAHSQIGMSSASFGKKHPTLYLLHGLSDDHTIWMRRTSIERYAAKLGIAVVMPAVNRSFYTDMAAGPKYWTFVSEELPALARSFFPLAEERELNYVAGLSMGGYGAMKLALTHPDRFAAAASLSGALDISHRALNFPGDFQLIYGDVNQIKGSANDLFHLAQKLASSPHAKPDLYQCCGTEDFLYEDNLRFRDYCREIGLDLTYEEGPGEHEWGYWDRQIQNVLNWLPLPTRG